MKAAALLMVLGVLLLSGCGWIGGDGAEEQAANDKARLENLEESNRRLVAQVDKLEGWYAELKRQVETMSQNRIATEDEIEAIVKDALEEQLAATENRRRDERMDRAKRRKELEERRRVARKQRGMDQMGERLNLSDEQKEQMTRVSEEMNRWWIDNFRKMAREGTFNREGIEKVKQEMIADHDEEMKKILTEKQFEQYQKDEDNILNRLKFPGLRDGHGMGHDPLIGPDGRVIPPPQPLDEDVKVEVTDDGNVRIKMIKKIIVPDR